MKKEQTSKGITIIALVITIIVLLILAAISITTLTGENGILTKASTSKLTTEQAEILEDLRLRMYEKQLDIETNITPIQYLQSIGIIKETIEAEEGKLDRKR